MKSTSSDSKTVSTIFVNFLKADHELVLESEYNNLKTLGVSRNPKPDWFGFSV